MESPNIPTAYDTVRLWLRDVWK